MAGNAARRSWKGNVTGSHGDWQISVVFQQKYRQDRDQNGLFSISKTCGPDIVLTIEKAGTIRTIIFDAKYRSSRESIHEAPSDIHVYRDAIQSDADQSAIEAA